MVVWNSTEAQFDEKRGEIVLISRHRLQDNQLMLKAGSNLTKCVGAVSILFVRPDLIGSSSQEDNEKSGKEESDVHEKETSKDENEKNGDTTVGQSKVAISLPASLSVVPVPSVNFMTMPPTPIFDQTSSELYSDNVSAGIDVKPSESEEEESADDEHRYEDDIENEDEVVVGDEDIFVLRPDDTLVNDKTSKLVILDSENPYTCNDSRYAAITSHPQGHHQTFNSMPNPSREKPVKSNFSFQNQLKRRVSEPKRLSMQHLSYSGFTEDNSNASSGSDTLVKRKRTIKQSENKCKYCKKAIFSWDDIVEHALSDHGMMSEDTDEVACPICKGLFSKRNMSAFIRHVKIHDVNWQKMAGEGSVDSSSSKSNSSNVDYEQEMQTDHSLENEHNATKIASSSFINQKSSSGKKRSIKSIQSARKARGSFRRLNARMTLETLKCMECSNHLSSYSDILHHCKQHNMFKQCPICGKKFTLRGGLLRHFITHVDNRVYACPNCPSSFTRKDNLKRHIETGCGKFKKLPAGSSLPDEIQDPKPKYKKPIVRFGKRRPAPSTGFPRISLAHRRENRVETTKPADDGVESENEFEDISIKQEVIDEDYQVSPVDEHNANSCDSVSDEQDIQMQSMNSTDMTNKSRSPTPVSSLRNADHRPVLSYTCSTCAVNFSTVVQLKRHVVMCHSEESPRPSSSQFNHSDSPEEEEDDVKSFVLRGDSLSMAYNERAYNEREPDSWEVQIEANRRNIKHELQEMDVIDIESLGQLAGVDSDSHVHNFGEQDRIQDGTDIENLVSYPSSTAASNSSSVTGGESPGNNQESDIQFEEDSIKYQDLPMTSGDQGSSSTDVSFAETCAELYMSSTPFRRKTSLNKLTPICSFCGIYFEKGVDVVHHIEEHASEISSPNTCVICTKELSGKDSLLRHANSHIGGWFTCHVCMTGFSRKDNLKRHIRKNHEDVAVDDLSFTVT